MIAATPALRSCLLTLLITLLTGMSCAELIPVRRPQGTTHAFLALRTLDGTTIATGDIMQSVHGAQVTSRLVFRFRDGSLDEETATFTQQTRFRLLADHHIQRGPSFPKPVDILINRATGEIISHGQDGKITQDHMDLPPDLSNGLILTLLMNIVPSTVETKLPFLVPGAKPRLVQLSIKPAHANQAFTVGGRARQATDYVIHIELGGITGVIAPMIGRQPSDAHIWVMIDARVPAFIREEGQLYRDGPVWRIEQISPAFAR